jgi:8-oxo-dGTP pyrophosphatase MutT (NUDIX family)
MSDAPAAPNPIPSATLLVLRDGAEGMEVFMVVRHHQIDFASGALVFPGGKADEHDYDARLHAFLDGADSDPDRCAIQVAAIREAFEECGILLARESGSSNLIGATRLAELESYRDRLHKGELSITEFAEREGLRLACDQLVHFAHWITPTTLPKRFDTHFFLAVAPADHLAIHDGHESVDSEWVRPADAIAGAESGRYTIIFPTLRNVIKLGQSETAAAAIAAANADTIVTVLPTMEQRDDGMYLCIPPEAGYDISEERMPAREVP